MGTALFLLHVSARYCSLEFFGYSFPGLGCVLSHVCVDQYSHEYLQGLLAALWVLFLCAALLPGTLSCELQLLWSPWTTALSPQLGEDTKLCLNATFLLCGLDTPTAVTGAMVELTSIFFSSFRYHRPSVLDAQCLKTIVLCILSSNLAFSGRRVSLVFVFPSWPETKVYPELYLLYKAFYIHCLIFSLTIFLAFEGFLNSHLWIRKLRPRVRT